MSIGARLKDRLSDMGLLAQSRIAPTATLRKVYPAGNWVREGQAERLAALCRAAGQALVEQPLLAASFDGRSKLSEDRPPLIQVGIAGGTRWLELIDPQAQGATLAAKIEACAETEGPRGRGLEILDMSDQGVLDWRGTLTVPRVARLVLLGPLLRPGADGEEAEFVPLIIDYSIQALDGTAAVEFLDRVAAALPRHGAKDGAEGAA